MCLRTLLIALALLWPAVSSGQGTAEVDIRDLGLNGAIERALGTTSQVITRADLETLTHLDAEERSIKNLSGLEFAINLQVLELGDNELTDLSPLATLTKLTELSAYGNKIADLSPLSKLTSLTKLNFWGNNEVVDLEPLRGLTGLTTLSLGYNRIGSTEPLSALHHLEALDISNNPITVLELAASDKMKSLQAAGLGIDDLSPFNYPNLELLDLTYNRFRDIEVFGGFPQLRELRLAHNQIDDLDEIMPFEHLEVLNLDHNHIARTEGLGQLLQLKHLMLGHNAVSDLAPLRPLKNLSSIRLWNAPLTNIEVLLELPNLQEASITGMFLDLSPGSQALEVIDTLKANGTSVAATSQRPVEAVIVPDDTLQTLLRKRFPFQAEVSTLDLASLVELQLKKEGLTNLNGLEHLINVKVLDLSNNAISDTSPLRNLWGLTRLNLSKNALADVSALSQLSNLHELELHKNMITDISPIINMPRLDDLNLSDNRLTDITPLTWKHANLMVERNYLEITPGSRNRTVIDSLITKGLEVAFEPQIPSEPVAVTFEGTGQTCTTTWHAEHGTFYAVWTSENLIDWTSGSLLEGADTSMSFALDCRPATVPRQFVRVVKYVE